MEKPHSGEFLPDIFCECFTDFHSFGIVRFFTEMFTQEGLLLTKLEVSTVSI
jgi:hypothetical protein